MYTFLYDENMLKKQYFLEPSGIFFYIDNDDESLYYYGNWGSAGLYYATLEGNQIFRGRIDIPKLIDRPLTNILDPVFLFERRRVKIKQTIVVSVSEGFISDDLMVKEMLSVYDVPKELDPFFNVQVYDTIKLIRQCKDIDTLKLYELSVLPYLHNCTMETIMQFTDAYNNKLCAIITGKQYAYSII